MKLARDSFMESIASTSIGTPMGGDSPQYMYGMRTRNLENVRSAAFTPTHVKRHSQEGLIQP